MLSDVWLKAQLVLSDETLKRLFRTNTVLIAGISVCKVNVGRLAGAEQGNASFLGFMTISDSLELDVTATMTIPGLKRKVVNGRKLGLLER